MGSFLNVVIYRLPRGLSIHTPAHSFCPTCKHRLTALDLVPILSWIFLRGKCRHCKAKVSSRYLYVELINGSIWALIWYQKFVVESDPLMSGALSSGAATAYAVAYMVFASALVAAIYTDLQHYIIPDQVNAFMLIAGLGLNVALYVIGHPAAVIWGMPSSVAGALVGWAVLWGIALLGRLAFGKDAMGHGDIKMARGIGAVLLPVAALMSFAIAIALGAVVGIAIILFRRLGNPDEEREIFVHTAGDSHLKNLLRNLRIVILSKQVIEAPHALAKAEARINHLLEGSEKISSGKRKLLGKSLAGVKSIAECVGSDRPMRIFLSDDSVSVRLNGDMSAWLYGTLREFDQAMQKGDLETAGELVAVIPDRAVTVFVGAGLDGAEAEKQVGLANRALDRLGITVRTTSDSSVATVIAFLVPEGGEPGKRNESDHSCWLTVPGAPSEGDFVAAALTAIGVNLPSHVVERRPIVGAELARAFGSKARARLKELGSIRSGCKEILANGEAPKFLFVEPVSSLFQCGLGYLLCIDVIGLAFPRLYERWFGENPYSVEDVEEEPVVDLTEIPFGPYLAAGALVAVLAEDWLLSIWSAYLEIVGLA